MRHVARLADNSRWHDREWDIWNGHTDVNSPPFDLFRFAQLKWMQNLPQGLPTLISRVTKPTKKHLRK